MFDDFSFKIVEPTGGGGGGIPNGGTTGQVLTKESNADGDANWETPSKVPPGGSIYTALSKLSNADGDFDWVLPYPPIGGPNVAVTGSYPNITISAVGGGGGAGLNSNYSGLNYLHNSNFFFNDGISGEGVPAGFPVSHVANRWTVIANNWGIFETEFSGDLTHPYITIHRISGTDPEIVRLIQILDTPDSINLPSNLSILYDYAGGIPGHGVLVNMTCKITTGYGVNETLESYLAGTWTGQTVVETDLFSTGDVDGTDTWHRGNTQFLSDATVEWTSNRRTQVAVEFTLEFYSNDELFDNHRVYFRNILMTDFALNASDNRQDWKSTSVVKKECDRYEQTFDAYLTTTPQTFKIDMRDIPTVSFSVGDSAAFTTTGTTKDSLIISVDNIGDVGIHTIHLDAEL